MLRLPFVVPSSLAPLLVLLFANPAVAQFGRTPTDGVPLPERSITARDDALALEVNPAGLAFVDGFDLQLAFSSVDGDYDGSGVFASYGGLGPIGLGASAQWLDNGFLGGDLKKFNFGLAGNLGGRFALGLTFNFIDSDERSDVDDFTSWDAGLQLRLTNYLALAGAVRDFNTPRLGDAVVDPRYTMGMAFQFVEGRYRAELEGIFDDEINHWFLVARAYVEPLDGLGIFAELRSSEVDDFGIARLHAGLSLGFGPASVTSSIIADFQGDAGVVGSSTLIRATNRRMRSLFMRRGFMAGITLTGALPERGTSSLFFGGRSRSFLDLLVYLDDLSTDEHVEGIVLRLENVGLGLGQHWELRESMSRLSEAGKEVVVYLSSADFGDLYLASAADRVYLAPGTPMFPAGLSTTLTYLGDLFDNIGILPEFVRIGEYKSAAEALTSSTPSEETLEAQNAYLDDVFGHMVGRIAEGRGMTDDEVRELIDAAPISASEARERGVVDDVRFYDEIERAMAEHYGRVMRIVPGYNPRPYDYRWAPPPRIAIVYIDGDIVAGGSGQFPIVGLTSGHRTLIETLEAIQRDGYEAVVLRVDSPGGSAFASEAIWRAIERVDERLPVVVSMGDVAASGGYYVAAGGREIIATPVTLTGSIGIFSGHFALRELFDWAGIHRFPLSRGATATAFGFTDPWTDVQREAVTRDITLMYETFLERVADNRGRTPDEIDPIARGRIWSGTRAEELGLVDDIGGLMAAIARARELAGLDPDEEVRLVSLPERSSLLGLFSLVGLRGEVEISESEAEGMTTLLQSLGLDRILRIPLLYGDGRPAARLDFELEGLE